MSSTMKQYKQLERRITKGDLDALLARWKFGRKLLKERGDAGRLPNGRLEQLANALASSRAELKNRIQFAEQYATEGDVKAAFKGFGSWSAICERGMGGRGGLLRQLDGEETTAEEKAAPEPRVTLATLHVGAPGVPERDDALLDKLASRARSAEHASGVAKIKRAIARQEPQVAAEATPEAVLEQDTSDDDAWWESEIGGQWQEVEACLNRMRWSLEKLQRCEATVDGRMLPLVDELTESCRVGMEADKRKLIIASLPGEPEEAAA